MLALVIAVLGLGCSGKGAADTAAPRDTGGAGPPIAEGCRARPAEADRERVVVVSYPYDASGTGADTWAAHTLTKAGALQDKGVRFELGRAYWGEVAFSPDGTLGVVAQDDGSLGIFLVTDGGGVEVVSRRYDGDFYAVDVYVDPSGEAAWVADVNWIENGGGLYRVPLDCATGEPGEAEYLLPIKGSVGVAPYHWRLDRAAAVGWEVAGADASAEAHVLDVSGAAPAVVASGEVFGDDEALMSDMALTWDDQYLLVADYSQWSGLPNRVAAVRLDGDSAPEALSLDYEDPVKLVPSPFDDMVLVLSGYGDAVESIIYRFGEEYPFSYGPTVASSALPGAADVLARGELAGLVLITENQGIRGVRFEGDGTATDLGLQLSGAGYEAIPGAIGIQP